MKLGPLNHVGVATPTIADSVTFLRGVLGATTVREPFDIPERRARVFRRYAQFAIELLEPLSEDTPIAAQRGYIDEVIYPHSTRRRIASGLRRLRGKRLENPWKKHRTMPL